jgi:hypothetical protein
MSNMAMRQHTFISFLCCPEWRGLLTVNMFVIYEDFKYVILTRTKELPEDDHLMIETCRSDF